MKLARNIAALRNNLQTLLWFFSLTLAMPAQGPADGAITGRVLLADGKPPTLARLEISLVDEESGQSQSLKIAAAIRHDGSFTLLRLAPGRYRIQALDTTSASHSAAVSITLEPGSTEDVTLRVSAIAPSGIAPPAPVSLQPEFLLSATSIAELPTREHEWEGLIELNPQANDATPAAPPSGEEQDGSQESSEAARRGGDHGGAVSAASGPSFAGLPSTQNAETLDGFSFQQNFRSGPRGAAQGGPVGGSVFGQSALRSLRVQPRNFSAQYGNGAGAVVAAGSRSGSQQIHGGGFYIARASAFAASNPFSTVTQYQDGVITTSLVKPQDTLNQFGARMAFPLIPASHRTKDQSSPALFASVEEQLRNNPAISTPSSPGFYSLSATQTALLRNRGVTATAQNAALNYLDSLSGAIPRNSSRTLLFVRADGSVSRRDRLASSYALNRFHSPAGTGFDQVSDAVIARGRGSVGDETLSVNAGTSRWLHTFSPRLNHELRFQWVRDLESEQPRKPLAQEPAISPGGYAPQVSIQPEGFAYGTPAGLGRVAYPDEQRLELANDMQLAFGRHLLMLGGNWSRIHDRIAQLQNAEGSYLYDSGTTGGHAGGLVDWITDYTFNVNAYLNGGCPSINAAVHDFCFRSFTQSFGENQTEFVTHDFAGFIQDSFRPRQDLSITLGVRYEYTLLPLPQQPNIALNAAFAHVAMRFQVSTASFPEDRNNLGPRASVSWSPAGGRIATVHASYGMFFGRLTGATVRAALEDIALPSSLTQIRITPTAETLCPQVANQGFGYPCAYVSAPPAAVAQTSSATLFASSFRLPAVQRASLTLERAFGHHLLVSAGYAGALAIQLPGSTDVNIAPATISKTFVIQGGDGFAGLHTGQLFILPLYTARRVAQYGPVTILLSNANATYHSGSLEAAFHARPLELRGSFTFSRAIDYAPQPSSTPRLNGQLDPFSNGYDKGLSSLNFPQRFTGQAIYESSLHRGPNIMQRSLSGWRIAAIAFAGSGAPYSYAIFGGTRLSGGRESLNGSGGATYLPTVGRNTLRLPPRGTVDVRLGREWSANRLRVTVFAEAFNLLNERNLSRVETRAFLPGTPASDTSPTPLIFQNEATIATEGLTARPFGTPTSSTAGLSRERQAELGVRLAF